MPESDKTDFTQERSAEILFTQLVLSFQAAAWQQLGKMPSIISGKIERNIEMAKHSIDMLGMLEQKTKGNLSQEESRFLQHTLYELRMNYLDEAKKGPDKKPQETSTESATPAADGEEKKEGDEQA